MRLVHVTRFSRVESLQPRHTGHEAKPNQDTRVQVNATSLLSRGTGHCAVTKEGPPPGHKARRLRADERR